MKGPFCHYLSVGAHVVVALVAFNFGLGAFGRDFLMSNNLVMQNMQLFQYLVLASSLWCVYLLVMGLQGKKGCKF